MLNNAHHDPVRIAQDFELSERLGAELQAHLDAGGQGSYEERPAPRPRRISNYVRRVNLLTGEVRPMWETKEDV